jgi:hypothetical protein
MKTAINKITVSGISSLTKEKQKAITDLKKRLLAKQVNRILYRLRKGFKARYASVGTIYMEGALVDLKELSIKFPSLGNFYKKTKKFINKYIDVWAVQMDISAKEGIPTTSNILESMNSIFKAFIKKAKCYGSHYRGNIHIQHGKICMKPEAYPLFQWMVTYWCHLDASTSTCIEPSRESRFSVPLILLV